MRREYLLHPARSNRSDRHHSPRQPRYHEAHPLRSGLSGHYPCGGASLQSEVGIGARSSPLSEIGVTLMPYQGGDMNEHGRIESVNLTPSNKIQPDPVLPFRGVPLHGGFDYAYAQTIQSGHRSEFTST